MPTSGSNTSGAQISLNAKQKKSLSVIEAENGFIVNEHFNGLLGSSGQHIAPDLNAAHEIIKAYFAKE